MVTMANSIEVPQKVKNRAPIRSGTQLCATHFFSNPQDNLEKVKFYPFPLEKLRLREQRSLAESHVAGSGCGQTLRQVPPWLPPPQVLGEDGELWM